MVYTLTVHLYANDKPDSIVRIKAKLIEAARIYRKDKETVDVRKSVSTILTPVYISISIDS
jgi:hypothetical protein